MLLNGTIRRRMCVSLVLLLGMLVTLSAAALTGLASYRRLVRELDFSIYEAPRRADLAEAVGSLFDPLTGDYPPTQEGADAQRREFAQRLEAARRRFADFHRRLDQLPESHGSAGHKRRTEAVLQKVDAVLMELKRKDLHRLGDPSTRRQVSVDILGKVARLQAQAQRVPDYQTGLSDSLAQARATYRSRIRLVVGTSAVVLVVFAGFGYFVYAGILEPVRKLHCGALRVAEGDFQYQLDLPGRGEMTDLANAFNRMTERFQESQQDLNQQVIERSRQLMRSERLAGIGFLAAGVAHEINNPLSAISMAAESLAQRADDVTGADDADNAVVETYLAMIRREAERCQQITHRLLNFARGNEGEREAVDLTRLVSEVLEMVRPMNKYRGRNVEFFRTQPCMAEVNGPEIKQVILNIVSNGLESMEEGGTLRIRLCDHADAVELTMTDDGCGMTTDVLEHLFEPFFTRRKDGRGTGLGMAISQRIVGDHAGTLEAESGGADLGSTFRIRLPRRAAQRANAA
ncbi:MAG: ATP-binding protein [Planctomycetaceae bacterium]